MSTPGRLLLAQALSYRASAVVWTPDARWLTVGGVAGSDFNFGVLTMLPAQPGAARWMRDDVLPVEDLVVSPDGRWLGVAGWRNVVVSVEDGTPRFPALDQFLSLVVGFSPDGSLVAWHAGVFESGSSIKVVDAATGAVRLDIAREDSFQWAFSTDSRRFATVGLENTLDLFNVDTGAVLQLPLGSTATDVAYSPDGRWLAAGCADNSVRLFDTTTDSLALTVPVGGTGLRWVTFSPDGRWLAVGGDLGTGIYSVLDGRPRLPGFADAFGKPLFSPDLRYFAATTSTGFAVFDAATGAVVWQGAVEDSVTDLAFSPDGRRLAAGGLNAHETGAVNVYDTGVDVSSHEHDARITALAMSPAGLPLIAVADNAPAVTVLAAESGARLARKPVAGTLTDLAFADGGQSLTAAGSAGVRLFSILGTRSWAADTIGTVNAVAVGGPAGEWIAAAAGRAAHLLSSADGSERWATPSPHPQNVNRIAMSRDGKWVATGCADRRTRLLDAATGVSTFGTAGDGKILDVAFGPRSALLATANEDGNVVIVDTATAAVRARITRGFGCSLLAFNHDETLLATAWDDNTVSIHDLTGTGTPPELRRLSYANPVTTLAFDPGGTVLCVANGTPTVVLIDPQTGVDVRWLPHPAPTRHVAFSANGTLIATASDDDVVRVVSTVDNQLD